MVNIGKKIGLSTLGLAKKDGLIWLKKIKSLEMMGVMSNGVNGNKRILEKQQ